MTFHTGKSIVKILNSLQMIYILNSAKPTNRTTAIYNDNSTFNYITLSVIYTSFDKQK